MKRTQTGPLDEQLIDALKSLAPTRAPNAPDRTNRAALAVLRRGLGQVPGAVPEMFRYVRELARVRPEREKDAFLTTSLFAWHPLCWPAANGPDEQSRARWTRNFGNSLAVLNVEAPGSLQVRRRPGVERRFAVLLAADHDDVGNHLRALVGLLRQNEVPVDWLQLLRDLGSWEHPDRHVQRRWARSFWGSTNLQQPPASSSAGMPTRNRRALSDAEQVLGDDHVC